MQKVTIQHDIYHKHPISGKLYRRRHSNHAESLKHFGVGLFGVNNEQHLQHRKLLTPAFHTQHIESYRDYIVMTPKQGMPMHLFRQDRRVTDGVGGVQGNVREMVKFPNEFDKQQAFSPRSNLKRFLESNEAALQQPPGLHISLPPLTFLRPAKV